MPTDIYSGVIQHEHATIGLGYLVAPGVCLVLFDWVRLDLYGLYKALINLWKRHSLVSNIKVLFPVTYITCI